MKYLVLGSSGQVGEQLVNYLKRNGKEVETFDIVEKALSFYDETVILENIISEEVDYLMNNMGYSQIFTKF